MRNDTGALRCETLSTAYKDCDSTIGIWNDPPLLSAESATQSTISVGNGKIHLLADASIAGISDYFTQWRAKRIGCLIDEPVQGDGEIGDWSAGFSVAGLLPRYLFQAGILCRRIYPSEHGRRMTTACFTGRRPPRISTSSYGFLSRTSIYQRKCAP